MKKWILIFMLFGLKLQAQIIAKPDTFRIPSELTNFHFRVFRNDSNMNNVVIDAIFYNNSSDSAGIEDSAGGVISWFDPDTNASSKTINYKLKRTTNSDSLDQFLVIQKVKIFDTVFPGESNNDGVVNHFDIFSLGLLYDQSGNPRSLNQENITFSPKKAVNWNTKNGFNGFNAKFADANGDGVINDLDYQAILNSYGNTTKTYTPLLSPNSAINKLSIVPEINDTLFQKDSLRLRFKTQLSTLQQNLIAQGVGFSYSAKIYKDNILLKTIPKDQIQFSFNANTNLFPSDNDIFKIESNLISNNPNQACIIKKKNDNKDISGEFGAVEIVIIEVDIGKIDTSKVRIEIQLDSIALVDNNGDLIPIQGDTFRFNLFDSCKLFNANINKIADGPNAGDVDLIAFLSPNYPSLKYVWKDNSTNATSNNNSNGNTWVLISSDLLNCNWKTSFDIIDTIKLSITSTKFKDIEIYYITSSKKLNINNKNANLHQVKIYDLLGQLMYSSVFSPYEKNQIPLDLWSNGIYFIHIDDQKSKKFIR
jgi:hypothetical protein